MTIDQQLALWCFGIPVHNLERDECCPDFPCCQPELLANEQTRIAFRDNPDKRDEFLMMFLGAAVALATKNKGSPKVYIAGQDNPDETRQ